MNPDSSFNTGFSKIEAGGTNLKCRQMAGRHLKTIGLALVLLATMWAGIASAQNYQVVHTETLAVTNHLTRTVSTVQVGNNPINRFLMQRVVKCRGTIHRLKKTSARGQSAARE